MAERMLSENAITLTGVAFFCARLLAISKGKIMATQNPQVDYNSMSEEQFVEALSQCPAYLDDKTMHEIEEHCQKHSHGVNRRMLLAVLTMDSEKLFEACETEAEAFFESFKCSAGTLGHYKRLVRLLDVGHNRLMIGLCTVDTDEPDAPFSNKEFFDAIHEAKGEDIDDDDGPSP